MTACRWVSSTEPREWRPVVGYVGHYEVSNLGEVRSIKHKQGPRLMKGRLNAGGYPSVYLWLDGSGRYRTVHRLVMAAFVGPCPPGQEVRHLDGNKLNANLSNLAYGSRSENMKDRVRHGTHNWVRRPEKCLNGHEWTEENTRIATRGQKTIRECRACCAERERMRRSRVAAKRSAA